VAVCSAGRNSGGFGIEEDQPPGAHVPARRIDRNFADDQPLEQAKEEAFAVEPGGFAAASSRLLVVRLAVVVASFGPSMVLARWG